MHFLSVTVRNRLAELGATLALVTQSRKLAREPWLQTGQARLGASTTAPDGLAPSALKVLSYPPATNTPATNTPAAPDGLAPSELKVHSYTTQPTPLQPPTGLPRRS